MLQAPVLTARMPRMKCIETGLRLSVVGRTELFTLVNDSQHQLEMILVSLNLGWVLPPTGPSRS